MQKQIEIEFKHNEIKLSGELDFSNVMSILKQSLSKFNSMPEIYIDFSQLKSSDSSGLALIIEWLKYAMSQKKYIQFNHLSQDLQSIVKVSGLESLIFSDTNKRRKPE